MSEVVAECAAITQQAAARTEAAAASQRESMARGEAVRVKHEEAVARQEAAVARQEAAAAKLESSWVKVNTNLDGMLDEIRADRAKAEAEREDEKTWRREYLRRQEKMFQDFFARADAAVAEGRENTEKILAVIRDQQEDLKAMREAILKLIDRLPPPPPHLRSA